MFKGNSISPTHLKEIQKRLKNGTILEFGSGYGTNELAKYYTVVSIEHDKRWKTPHSVLVPIKNGFYDISEIELPEYDAILVDGPSRDAGDRRKFAEQDLDFTKLLIIDDVHRDDGCELLGILEKKIGRKGEVIDFVSANGRTEGKFAIL